jgi:undecaprenyl-diphosphatase
MRYGIADRRFRIAIRLAPALLVSFLLIGFAAHAWLIVIDEQLAVTIRSTNAGLFGAVARLMKRLGSLPVWDTLVLIAAAVLWTRKRRLEAKLLVAALSVEAATILVKVVGNSPADIGSEFGDFLESAGDAHFPSGHVARTAVTLGVLVALFAWRKHRWRLSAVLAASGFVLLMGIARVASGAHRPSDVLGGLLLGALWLDLLFLVSAHWRSRIRGA